MSGVTVGGFYQGKLRPAMLVTHRQAPHRAHVVGRCSGML